MKKTMKRAISLCLVVVMAAGLLCVSSFAAGATKQYGSYVVIGDSIATGFGLDTYGSSSTHAENSDMTEMNAWLANGGLVTGSYPAEVAAGVGATDVYQMQRPAIRTVEVRRLLDSSYKGDQYTESVLAAAQITGSDWAGLKANAAAKIAGADLITLNIGSDDVIVTGFIAMYAYLAKLSAIQKSSLLTQQLAEAKALMANLGTLGEAFNKMLDLAEEVGAADGAIAALSAGAVQGVAQFKVNWNVIQKAIHKLNPDVTLVVVGMYNPFRDLKLTGASLLSVGKLADQVVNMMNLYMQTSLYSRYYTYVSVLGTTVYPFSPLVSGTFSDELLKNVHPTAAGHEYMAEQILSALPAAGSGTSAASASLGDFGLIGKALARMSSVLAAVK